MNELLEIINHANQYFKFIKIYNTGYPRIVTVKEDDKLTFREFFLEIDRNPNKNNFIPYHFGKKKIVIPYEKISTLIFYGKKPQPVIELENE